MKSKRLKQYEAMEKLLERLRIEEKAFLKRKSVFSDSFYIPMKPHGLLRIEQELASLARQGIVPTMSKPER